MTKMNRLKILNWEKNLHINIRFSVLEQQKVANSYQARGGGGHRYEDGGDLTDQIETPCQEK